MAKTCIDFGQFHLGHAQNLFKNIINSFLLQ